MAVELNQARVDKLAAMLEARMGIKKTPALHVVGATSANASERAAYAAHSAGQLSDGCPALPEVDASPSAIQRRAVLRIAQCYPWGMGAVRHFLDTRGVAYLSDLSEPQLDDLHERMLAYKDAADNGFSSPDEPAAY